MDLKTEIINTKNGVEIYPYTTRSGDIIMIKPQCINLSIEETKYRISKVLAKLNEFQNGSHT